MLVAGWYIKEFADFQIATYIDSHYQRCLGIVGASF